MDGTHDIYPPALHVISWCTF